MMVEVLSLRLLFKDEEAKAADVQVRQRWFTFQSAFKVADEGREARLVPGDGVRTEITGPVSRLEEVERISEADTRVWLALPERRGCAGHGHPRLLVHIKRCVIGGHFRILAWRNVKHGMQGKAGVNLFARGGARRCREVGLLRELKLEDDHSSTKSLLAEQRAS